MLAFPKPFRLELPDYTDLIRQQRCIVLGCRESTEPHHIRYAWNAGTGTKPSDTYSLPCCRTHHDKYHAIGREPFEQRHGLDLLRLIAETLTRYMAEKEAA